MEIRPFRISTWTLALYILSGPSTTWVKIGRYLRVLILLQTREGGAEKKKRKKKKRKTKGELIEKYSDMQVWLLLLLESLISCKKKNCWFFVSCVLSITLLFQLRLGLWIGVFGYCHHHSRNQLDGCCRPHFHVNFRSCVRSKRMCFQPLLLKGFSSRIAILNNGFPIFAWCRGDTQNINIATLTAGNVVTPAVEFGNGTYCRELVVVWFLYCLTCGFV